MTARSALTLLGMGWLVLFFIGLNIEAPYFRPFEQIRTTGPTFKPNRQISMQASGGLAYRYVIPEHRHFRKNVFTTDKSGFRNPPMAQPRVIVIGDSFVVGVGLSDHETIAQQLKTQLGEPVYNYGTQGADGPRYFLSDRRFGRPGEIILFMPSENHLRDLQMPTANDEVPKELRKPIPMPRILRRLRTYGSVIQESNQAINRDNGLTIFARKYYQWIRRAMRSYPNQITVENETAIVETLLEQSRTRRIEDKEFERIVQSYSKWQEILQQRKSRLIVAIIPETGSIYEEHFPPKAQKQIIRPSLRERLQVALQQEGISTIDLYSVFRAHREPYLYLRDDTHWNASTVRLTAASIGKEFERRRLKVSTSTTVRP